jgi:hypothetical protein
MNRDAGTTEDSSCRMDRYGFDEVLNNTIEKLLWEKSKLEALTEWESLAETVLLRCY